MYPDPSSSPLSLSLSFALYTFFDKVYFYVTLKFIDNIII